MSKPLDLTRALYWYTVVACTKLLASIILWLFGGQENTYGLIYSACEVPLIAGAYLLMRAGFLALCVGTVGIWVLAVVSVQAWRTFFAFGLSPWGFSLFLGVCLYCSVILYFAALEIRKRKGLTA
jgi:hypothetical protein